jgi:hypothetical protein
MICPLCERELVEPSATLRLRGLEDCQVHLHCGLVLLPKTERARRSEADGTALASADGTPVALGVPESP